MFNKTNCFKCSGKAVYYKVYNGTYLCASCFCSSIINKVKKTISKYNLLDYGNTIGIAISGGKDSLSLLKIMKEICEQYSSKIIAITIDEGISKYSSDSIKICQFFTKKFSIPYYTVSFKDIFNFSLDEIIQIKERKISACSICGTLKRRALDIVVKKLHVDVLATAHNLDDVLQSFYLNLYNCDISRVKWFNPVIQLEKNFLIKRIKPFFEIYEKEIAMYTFLQNIPFQINICPYMNEGMRSEIRLNLNALEAKHPGIKYSALNSAIKVSQNISFYEKEHKLCEKCNMVCSSKLCSVCKILGFMKRVTYI